MQQHFKECYDLISGCVVRVFTSSAIPALDQQQSSKLCTLDMAIVVDNQLLNTYNNKATLLVHMLSCLLYRDTIIMISWYDYHDMIIMISWYDYHDTIIMIWLSRYNCHDIFKILKYCPALAGGCTHMLAVVVHMMICVFVDYTMQSRNFLI